MIFWAYSEISLFCFLAVMTIGFIGVAISILRINREKQQNFVYKIPGRGLAIGSVILLFGAAISYVWMLQRPFRLAEAWLNDPETRLEVDSTSMPGDTVRFSVLELSCFKRRSGTHPTKDHFYFSVVKDMDTLTFVAERDSEDETLFWVSYGEKKSDEAGYSCFMQLDENNTD